MGAGTSGLQSDLDGLCDNVNGMDSDFKGHRADYNVFPSSKGVALRTALNEHIELYHTGLGPAGSAGPAGPARSAGPAGPAGPVLHGTLGDYVQFATGLSGSTGFDDTNGTPGPMGKRGPTGKIGTPGPMGKRGPTGFEGKDGMPGPMGQRGPYSETLATWNKHQGVTPRTEVDAGSLQCLAVQMNNSRNSYVVCTPSAFPSAWFPRAVTG